MEEPQNSSSMSVCPFEGCSKSFSRPDHMRRHFISAHEKSMPHACHSCGRRFTRSDLLKRHLLIHANEQKDGPRNPPRPRVRKACLNCALRKLKCDGEQPCARCQNHNDECVYDKPPLRTSPFEDGLSGASQDSARVDTMFDNSQIQGALPTSEPQMMTSIPSLEGSDRPDFEHVANPFLWQQTDALNHRTVSTADLPHEHHPYSFSWSGSTDAPSSNAYSMALPERLAQTGVDPSPFGRRNARAFSENVPTHLSNPASLEVANSHIPTHNRSWSSTGSIIRPYVNEGFRDSLVLLMMQSNSTVDTMAKATTTAPPVEILNELLETVLVQQGWGVNSWIHTKLLLSSHSQFLILCCLVTLAATQRPLIIMQKFGYTLHEAIRKRLTSMFEQGISVFRDKELAQVLLLNNQVGIWSGYERETEACESLLNLPITIIRRGGLFRGDRYEPFRVSSKYLDEQVDQKWTEFVNQESRKRLAIQQFLHQAQSSMAYLVGPLVSISELQMSLPCAVKSWSATTSMSWNDTLLDPSTDMGILLPSFAECMVDITKLVRVGKYVDFTLSAYVIIHGYWGLVYQYQELKAHSRNSGHVQSDFSNTEILLHESYRNQLVYDLENFSSQVLSRFPKFSSDYVFLSLYHALITMYVYVRLSAVQNFAGDSGVKASKIAVRDLRAWFSSSDSRNAVKYAALILQKGVSLGQGSIRDFTAIALYHAALVLWAYGILLHDSVSQGGGDSAGLPSTEDANAFVDLGGDDENVLQLFMSGSVGNAVVHDYRNVEPGGVQTRSQNPGNSRTQMILLSDPRAVMESSICVLKRNHDPLGEGMKLPALVQALTNLMTDLMNATTARQ